MISFSQQPNPFGHFWGTFLFSRLIRFCQVILRIVTESGALAGGCLCGLPRSRADLVLRPEYGLTIQIPLASASSVQSNLKFAVYCRYGAAAAIHPIRNFRKAHFAFA